jgi:carbamoyltransferase
MLLVAQVAKEKQIQMTDSQQSLFGIDKLNIPRSSIPAVTHVDYSARIQTVHSSTNPRFHSLLERFYELTGIPILVNTSFNIRGEPIVESPKDAFKCFMGTEIDLLAIGNNLLLKSDQPLHLVSEYRSEYGRD